MIMYKGMYVGEFLVQKNIQIKFYIVVIFDEDFKNLVVFIRYIFNYSYDIKRMFDVYRDYQLQFYEIVICVFYLIVCEVIRRIIISGNYLFCCNGLIEWG